MNKRHLALAVLVSGLAAFSTAAPLYRIALRQGNESVLARDKPVTRGSVVLFHRYPDGRLTSIPQENVAGFVATEKADESAAVHQPARPVRRRAILSLGTSDAAVAVAPARPLEPGEVRVLGTTGDGGSANAGTAGYGPMTGASSRDVAARSAIDAQVFPGDLPAPNGATGSGGAMYNQGTNVNGQPLLNGPVLNPTLSGAAPANPAAATVPQTGNQPINPNGFPATTATGPQAGAAQPVDANGFPAAPQPGQSSTAQPAQNTGGQTNANTNARPGNAQPNTNGQVQNNGTASPNQPATNNNGQPAQNTNTAPKSPNGASKQ